MPTYLEAAGVEIPESLDGKSFISVLEGKKQNGREYVFTQFHETAAKQRYPMRCVQNKRFGYIFNPWSDGERVFKNESQQGRSFEAMQEAARNDKCIADRVHLFQYRVIEEFYDFENDPDALNNLINDSAYSSERDKFRSQILEWMKQYDDPALKASKGKNSPELLETFMKEQQIRSYVLRLS